MNYQSELVSLKGRLERAIQGFKPIDGAVTNTSMKQCETHGEFECHVRYMEKMPTIKTSTECPHCLNERITEIETRIARHNEWVSADALRNLMVEFDVPKRFEKVNLDNYDPVNREAERCLKVCKAYAKKWPDRLKQGGGLVMCGLPGTGKNHLAIAIGKHVIQEHQSSVKFTSAIKIARDFKSTWSKSSDQTESEVINRYSTPDLLIIDEIGVQFGSDAEKIILFEIVNNRYESMKPTILLSNLPKDELSEFIGERVLDRMNDGGGCTLMFTWESYRSRQPAA
ncbi:ATP-binding protein [Xenorhabdus sp. XENO-1]|uniref:ATP-binding protein n=1 Tax=Xenorhabdus bovienii TaxID=40576 RepID=UPI0020CA77B7|nr:ATP-binding protein [Xenorhabdus bovienii]MCP9269696.1 ATP-binding protein [Xenorhabdus bovienii subsp. africana]